MLPAFQFRFKENCIEGYRERFEAFQGIVLNRGGTKEDCSGVYEHDMEAFRRYDFDVAKALKRAFSPKVYRLLREFGAM